MALGLNVHTLEAIKSNNLHEVKHCLTEALAAWLNGEDRPQDSPPPNWKEVVDALKSPTVNLQAHATQLAQQLTGRCTCMTRGYLHVRAWYCSYVHM